MTNDDVYAAGILNRALDPTTQPEAIREFLSEEQRLIEGLVPDRARVIDFGCGMGRHLVALRQRLALGVGIDYEKSYIKEALKQRAGPSLHFFVSDATVVPLRARFDIALCLTNTWGTMTDKLAVLAEMRRLAPAPKTRFITVYSPSSVEPRCQWYANMGHPVIEVTEERITAQGGFGSEHFTEDRVRSLVGACELKRIGSIAFLIAT